MLLEMDVKSLKQILDNSTLFDKKLHEALEVLHNVENEKNSILNGLREQELKGQSTSQSTDKRTVSCKTNMDHERDDLVEQLYHKIVAKYPTKAYKITGMFLEMDINRLKELNENSELFDKQITESLKV